LRDESLLGSRLSCKLQRGQVYCQQVKFSDNPVSSKFNEDKAEELNVRVFWPLRRFRSL
jgi:hypothetical protein